MLLRPAEFTHASEKLEFTTKEFGASGALRGPYHFVGWAAVANQLAAAWMWLASAMPLSTVHSNSLPYFYVILRNPWFTGWGRKIYTPIFPNISVICKDIELIFCTDIHEHVDIQATVAPLDMTSLCFTTASKRTTAERHERRTALSSRLDQAVWRVSFRLAVLLWGVAQTPVSRMDQIAKSIGFRSGLEGGHMSLSQKSVMWAMHHCWVTFAVCDGAPSCTKT